MPKICDILRFNCLPWKIVLKEELLRVIICSFKVNAMQRHFKKFFCSSCGRCCRPKVPAYFWERSLREHLQGLQLCINRIWNREAKYTMVLFEHILTGLQYWIPTSTNKLYLSVQIQEMNVIDMRWSEMLIIGTSFWEWFDSLQLALMTIFVSKRYLFNAALENCQR